MPEATKYPTQTRAAPPPTRRGLLAAGASILAATGAIAGALGAPVPVASNSLSPAIIPLWAAWSKAHAALEKTYAESSGLRAQLVARYGECRGKTSGFDMWGHDPDYPRLKRVNAECDEANSIEGERLDEIMAFPAETVADVAAKLTAVMTTQRHIRIDEDEADYCEILMRDFLLDAQRVLCPMVTA